MKYGPEIPISIGEPFLIRDAKDPKPIAADVVNVRWMGEGVWQRVGLKRIGIPRNSFEMSTLRRMQYGVYTDRHDRYRFLRIEVLPFEELIRYFDNGSRQVAEEFIKNSPTYVIIDK